MSEICDGNLVRLARDGDPAASRLLVERHQPMARARAARLCPNPSDVDDIVQESFLQAFIALDRLRDPDRFAGWLAGIVHNVCRGPQRRAPVTLLADWPEPVHPAAADGLPSAEDLDRADALRAAVADLPAGQRRAVALHYYADLPPGQIAESAGAARASLHKARLRLRAYLTEHRPDLVPPPEDAHDHRPHRARRGPHPRPAAAADPPHPCRRARRRRGPPGAADLAAADSTVTGSPGSLTPGRAAGQAGAAAARNADELTGRLLRAAGASVTEVDIDELGPEVTAARIALASPAGTRHVTARLAEGLAIAITAGAPLRVADPVMDRLAAPAQGAGPGRPRPAPPLPSVQHGRPRYEPRNLDFADGLEGWLFGGSFTTRQPVALADYSCVAEHGTAVLSSAVPEPAGFAFLGQDISPTTTGRPRSPSAASCAPRMSRGAPACSCGSTTGPRAQGPLTEAGALATRTTPSSLAGRDWTRHEVTARVAADSDIVVFGLFLAGRGRIELRHAELTRLA